MSEPSVKIHNSIDHTNRPQCGNCGIPMWLLNIKPAELGLELCTYECARCAASQTLLVRTNEVEPNVNRGDPALDRDIGGGR